MTKITLNGIGLAERVIIRTALSDETQANRTSAYIIKRLRRSFRLRELPSEIDDATETEKRRLIDSGRITEEAASNMALTWDTLIEDGWHKPDPNDEEVYGDQYDVDATDASWLASKIEQKTHWREDREGNALPLESAMVEAIANLMEALEVVTKKED